MNIIEKIPKLIIHTDGGARGNPGPAAVGVVIETTASVLVSFGKKIGPATNNVAEYEGVAAAFSYLCNKQIFAKEIIVYLDSKLVAEQLTGNYKIKKPHLHQLYLQVKHLEKQIGERVAYIAVSREQNVQADVLVNNALDTP